jgi:hypothetical protein
MYFKKFIALIAILAMFLLFSSNRGWGLFWPVALGVGLGAALTHPPPPVYYPPLPPPYYYYQAPAVCYEYVRSRELRRDQYGNPYWYEGRARRVPVPCPY